MSEPLSAPTVPRTAEDAPSSRLPKLLAIGGGLLALVPLVWIGHAWWDSRLPTTYSVTDYGSVDDGGGGPIAHHHAAGHVSVASLRGPVAAPDVRMTLAAQQGSVRLSSGKTVEALTFDGSVPGPEIRVRQHELVEVTLVNRDVDDGVSIHWHGVDVPNGEDGVSGVTQDAVLPGDRHTYRFRADQAGTYWYHSHQRSAKQVRRGLYGALVVLPARPLPRGTLDLTAVAHNLGGADVLNASDTLQRRAVASRTPVRLRLVNSDNVPRRFTLAGTAFRVAAVDGADFEGPQLLRRRALVVAAGGRYDVAFTMPATPVRLSLERTEAGIALSRDGSAAPAAVEFADEFDPAAYGKAGAPLGELARPDRRFELDIGRRPGFLDGRPGIQWSVNGKIYPDVPMYHVRLGDVVQIQIQNGTPAVHPMHLHGHHVRVLSRDGRRVRGAWWVDTLDVLPHETYIVAFRARNPGVWMLHCHNLNHAAKGLTMHLTYAGVVTPFRIGDKPRNRPE